MAVPSPELPSLDELLTRQNSRVPSGSRAVSVPEDVVKGFSKASDLLRCQYTAADSNELSIFEFVPEQRDEQDVHVDRKRRKPRKATTSARRDTKVALSDKEISRTKAPKAVRGGKANSKADRRSGHFEQLGLEAGDKKRGDKAQAGIQTKIRKAKIKKIVDLTDNDADNVSSSKVVREETQTTFKAAETQAIKAKEKKVDLPLGLEKAPARRRDWTPVKNKENIFDPIAQAPTKDASVESPSQGAKVSPALAFDSLVTNFAFDGVSGERTTSVSVPVTGQAATKRRKLDLIDSTTQSRLPSRPNTSSRSKSPQKHVASRRKPQTITAKATRQFREDIDQESVQAPTLLSYFPQSSGQQGQFRTHEGKSSVQKKPKRSQGKKEEASPSIFPPETALKDLGRQNLLFGTSSQLVREDSPTLVRDLQSAMRNSEVEIAGESPLQQHEATRRLSGLRQARSALWSAAARDTQGSLLEAEIIDLTHENQAPGGTLNIKPTAALNSSNSTLLIDNNGSLPLTAHSVPVNFSGELCATSENGVIENRPPDREDDRSLHCPSELRTQDRSTNHLLARDSILESADCYEPPSFEAQSIEELRAQVAAYGFKPIRAKKNMIALLEKCWRSKNRSTLPTAILTGSVVARAPSSIEGPSKTMKRRGRPPKEKAHTSAIATAINDTRAPRKRGRPRKVSSPISEEHLKLGSLRADEIIDDAPPMPFVPRQTHSQPPEPLHLVDPETETPVNSKTSTTGANGGKTDCSHMHSKIADAIRTYPPSNDPNKLTWHEKILLYDPIVLEDLTSWLNTVGLGRVGIDDEVWPSLVREWCEDNSICCLWKVNLRGGGRARY